MADDALFAIAGQEFKVTSPDRVLYPATGTTKLDVIRYYAEASTAMLPQVQGRPATRKRWPEGVDKAAFFVKDLEPGTPPWLARVQIRHGSGPKFYPVFDTPAALAWLGQVAALELHVPQWRVAQPAGPSVATSRSDERYPDRVVFDLDPGPGAGLAECVDVALALRERLGPLGQRVAVVTTGSKGLHLYVPMDDPITSSQASEWARLAAEELEKALPSLVVSRMAKSLRVGKVLVDWSQNNRSKTTIAPYSLRGCDQPTVAAPRTWAELSEPGLRHLDYREVLDRLADGLDPLADLHRSPDVLAVAVGGTAVRAGRRPSIRVTRRTPRPARPTRPVTPREGLPADLTGPVELELAKAVPALPGPHALPGRTRWELKFDGFRAAVVRTSDTVRIWSRNKTDMTLNFPEIASAAMRMLPPDSVCDGELVAWSGDRLSFDLLQQRLAAGAARSRALATEHPASYVVFDLLAANGVDLRGRRFDDRRAQLQTLTTTWSPPMQLSPITDDLDTAKNWLAKYAAAGIEGVVAKGAATTYRGGVRGWQKFKHRTTEDAVIGAVIGPVTRPESIVAGRYTHSGQLVIVGRSVPLSPAQSASLGAVLIPAGSGHPWPDTIISSRFGAGRDRVRLTKVKPTIVAEFSADTARQAGVWRHGVRYLRYRPELRPDDIPTLPEHAQKGG